MVLIDTSVWVALFRKRSDQLGQYLWSLVARNAAVLCGQIILEYIGGFRDRETREEKLFYFESFPYLETSRTMYCLAANLAAEKQGLGFGDAVIAATALVHKVPLLTLDKAFEDLKPYGLQLAPVPH